MKLSFTLLSTLVFATILFTSCSSSETEERSVKKPVGLIGDYKCIKLMVRDKELGEALIGSMSLSLNADSTFTGNDIDRIDSRISTPGKWKLTDGNDSLKLNDVSLALEKNSVDTLQLRCESNEVEFHVTFLRTNETTTN